MSIGILLYLDLEFWEGTLKTLTPSLQENAKYFTTRSYLTLTKGGLLMLESEFQNKLIQELKKMFKGCIVTKLDSSHIQGIPDLLILYNNKWATLECKKSVRAKKQPNQEYYVGRMNEMSFSRFICPENKEEVLHDLQQAFCS